MITDFSDFYHSCSHTETKTLQMNVIMFIFLNFILRITISCLLIKNDLLMLTTLTMYFHNENPIVDIICPSFLLTSLHMMGAFSGISTARLTELVAFKGSLSVAWQRFASADYFWQ